MIESLVGNLSPFLKCLSFGFLACRVKGISLDLYPNRNIVESNGKISLARKKYSLKIIKI